MSEPEEFKAALKAALNLLRHRDYFESRLRDRLLQKGFPDVTIDQVIGELTRMKVLNDQRLLSNVLEQKRESRSVSKQRILADLIRHGADADETTRQVAEIPDDSENVIAVNLLRKHYPAGDSVPKMARFLANRGFREDTIRAALEEIGFPIDPE